MTASAGPTVRLALTVNGRAVEMDVETFLVASAIDGLAVSRAVVAPSVCEALAILERRSPGRLETIHAQSPRGRATLASAIARAYRAVGGLRDEA